MLVGWASFSAPAALAGSNKGTTTGLAEGFFFFNMDLVDLHSFTLVSLSQATQNALP